MSTMVNVFNVATSTRTETVSQTTVTNIFPVVVAVTSTQTNPVVSVNENSQTTFYQNQQPPTKQPSQSGGNVSYRGAFV